MSVACPFLLVLVCIWDSGMDEAVGLDAVPLEECMGRPGRVLRVAQSLVLPGLTSKKGVIAYSAKKLS